MKQMRLTFDKTTDATKLFFSLLLILLSGASGVLFLINPQWMEKFILTVVIALSVLNGASVSLQLYTDKRRAGALICLLIHIGLGLLLYLLANPLRASIVRAYGLWLIVSGLVRGTLCFQALHRKLGGALRHALSSAVSIGFGVGCLISPDENTAALTLLIGGYLLFQTLFALWDFFLEILDLNEADRIKRRVRIPLPLFITAFIPLRVLNRFNKYFAPHSLTPPLSGAKAGDLEVFIHVVNDGPSAFGHVDICYKNTIYSYGVYDHHSNKLFGLISDGAVAIVDRERYLNYSLDVAGKLLTGFTIDLTDRQDEIIRGQLDELFSLLTPWRCDAEKAERNNLPSGEYNDPASALYKATGAKLYKVTKGKFKKYYAFSTNCVALADYLIGPSGIDMKGISGIITPGTYYSLLDSMYRRKNSIVTAKTLYKTLSTSS